MTIELGCPRRQRFPQNCSNHSAAAEWTINDHAHAKFLRERQDALSRTYKVGYTQYDYYFNKLRRDALHGVFVIPKDLPSTIASTMPIFRAENKMGIKSDAEFGMSGTRDPDRLHAGRAGDQVAQLDYGRNGLDYKGTVLCARRRRSQGVDTVKVWDCSVQCYDKRLIQRRQRRSRASTCGSTSCRSRTRARTPTLDGFLKYDKNPDGFGAQAFIAARSSPGR